VAEFERLVAPNPGPMTLEGTNTYVFASGPAWVIDPGPGDPGHLERVREAAAARGGIGGVLLTHSHADHTEGVEPLGAPVADPGEAPVEVIETPGHAPDHVSFVFGAVCFCGDLILGHGSAIVPPASHGGSLADYLASLRRLQALDLDVLAPGHGPPIDDPAAKIAEYLEHRLARELALVAALEAGERSRGRLLDAAWADVPEPMRTAAALAMQAHLEKLEAEGAIDPGELVD
jgi:glyoxylase-like metal-dependent hydrolase (beta-lactamase superfamily II)